MRTIVLAAALILGAALPAAAQDSLRARPRGEAQLRQMIEQRFAAQMREQLGLTDDQMARMRVALATISARRRVIEERERELRRALAGQLRPGIAANPDSVTRLLDGLAEQRLAYAQSFSEELRELSGILTPIQRGQYFLARERLLQRVQEIRQQRQMQGGRPPL